MTKLILKIILYLLGIVFAVRLLQIFGFFNLEGVVFTLVGVLVIRGIYECGYDQGHKDTLSGVDGRPIGPDGEIEH